MNNNSVTSGQLNALKELLNVPYVNVVLTATASKVKKKVYICLIYKGERKKNLLQCLHALSEVKRTHPCGKKMQEWRSQQEVSFCINDLR